MRLVIYSALTGLLVGAAVALAIVSLSTNSSVIQASCRQVNTIQTEIYGVINRQARGVTTNPYFKQHPDQLASAQDEINRELMTFASPIQC